MKPLDPTRVSFDVLVGLLLGEYRVIERINQGGMAVLYRGEVSATGRPVAIKVLLPEIAADPNLVNRLVAEARAANSIRHPNIIDILCLGQLPDGRHYLVMELLEGQSLAELLRDRGRLQVPEVKRVLEQAMSALTAAHAAGVIHRDLKPENIFVNPLPEGWRITLLDFGLAKQQGSLSQVTAANLMLGTPSFMAPEQVRGQEATGATDIYAMGIVAWTLLTGREPFAGGSIVEVMKRHLEAPVPALRPDVPGVPLVLEELVAQMMAKDPAARPSAPDVLQSLGRLEQEPPQFVQADRTQLLPALVPAKVLDPSLLSTRPDHPPRHHEPGLVDFFVERKVALLMAALGLALIGGAVGLFFFRPPAPLPPAPVAPPVVRQPVTVPVENAVVVVDPPRPATVSRAEVERTLASSRAKVASLKRPARRTALRRLDKLEARLKKNDPPAVIARELEKLLKDHDLK